MAVAMIYPDSGPDFNFHFSIIHSPCFMSSRPVLLKRCASAASSARLFARIAAVGGKLSISLSICRSMSSN